MNRIKNQKQINKSGFGFVNSFLFAASALVNNIIFIENGLSFAHNLYQLKI